LMLQEDGIDLHNFYWQEWKTFKSQELSQGGINLS